jgi:hypothetical protein
VIDYIAFVIPEPEERCPTCEQLRLSIYAALRQAAAIQATDPNRAQQILKLNRYSTGTIMHNGHYSNCPTGQLRLLEDYARFRQEVARASVQMLGNLFGDSRGGHQSTPPVPEPEDKVRTDPDGSADGGYAYGNWYPQHLSLIALRGIPSRTGEVLEQLRGRVRMTARDRFAAMQEPPRHAGYARLADYYSHAPWSELYTGHPRPRRSVPATGSFAQQHGALDDVMRPPADPPTEQ